MLTHESLELEAGIEVVTIPAEPDGYAAEFYRALRTLDTHGLDRILLLDPPTGGRWEAVRDRVVRASS
ncbi:SUA5 domain protein [compost metagenome]